MDASSNANTDSKLGRVVIPLSGDENEKIGNQIANSVVGFVKLDANASEEFANLCGSGTLARVGSIHGIVTAAHVLEELPDNKEIGISLCINTLKLPRKLKVDMNYAEKLCIGTKPFHRSGPDLAFLKLPQNTVESLRSTSSFLNIKLRKDEVLSSQRLAPIHSDCIAGVISEDSEEIFDKEKSLKMLMIGALCLGGDIKETREEGQMDFVNFYPTYAPNVKTPQSFKGASGGGLWRLFFNRQEQETPVFHTARLYGVIFYETPSA